jgi:hypothetical protein
VYRVLVGKPEGRRPLGKPRHRWEDNIRMDLWKWDVGVWTGWIFGSGMWVCGLDGASSALDPFGSGPWPVSNIQYTSVVRRNKKHFCQKRNSNIFRAYMFCGIEDSTGHTVKCGRSRDAKNKLQFFLFIASGTQKIPACKSFDSFSYFLNIFIESNIS